MAGDPDTSASIEELLRDSRATRQSIHDLVARMRQDQRLWERELTRLLRRTRLTATQRLRERYVAGRGRRDSTVC